VVATVDMNFMLGIDVISKTDLISMLPKRFVAMHAERFGIAWVTSPMSVGRQPVMAVAPKAATQQRKGVMAPRVQLKPCAPWRQRAQSVVFLSKLWRRSRVGAGGAGPAP
jgi:hypothetical protein